MNNWKVIDATGLKKTNEEFNCMIFIHERAGFLFGTNYTDDILLNKKFNEQNAVIYKTDDSGKKWTANSAGKGYFIDALFIEGDLYALSNKPSKDSYAYIDSSSLFVSIDTGKNWTSVFTFPFYVREIKFENSQSGVAITKKQNEKSQWKVLKTNNGGKKWEEVLETPSIEDPLFANNMLWYFSKNQIGDYRLNSVNVGSKILNNEKMPYGFEPRKITLDIFNDFWLAGLQDKNTVIYHRDKMGKYSLVKRFEDQNFYPVYINIIENSFSVVLGEMKLPSVEYRFFRSSDNGKSWLEEPLLIKSYLRPVCFYKDLVWAYSGAGRIQVRDH